MRSFQRVTVVQAVILLQCLFLQGLQQPHQTPSSIFVQAFGISVTRTSRKYSSSVSPLHVMDASMLFTQSLAIATIDGDIDKIPTNEFATVFAGGMMVMLGGLLSTILVGAIVEKGNLYADLVAESYDQDGADNSDIWKNLSEEEKQKLSKIMNSNSNIPKGILSTRIKELQNNDDSVLATAVEMEEKSAFSNSSSGSTSHSTTAAATRKDAKVSDDMFSDY